MELFFWLSLLLIFYTYLGYGVVLFLLVKIKELFWKRRESKLTDSLPEVTLFITAYNEEKIVEQKMKNCRELSYPSELLKIVWVTDGSNDKTMELLNKYSDVKVLHRPERSGKTSAMNRGMTFVESPIVVFTDANTMLNREAILEIVKEFTDPIVGCVAGEKRVLSKEMDSATAGEGIYWKYESTLKALDYRLYSAVGAAGELFAVRKELFEPMPADTLLDDFIISLKIAQKGYKIAYCNKAFAMESASLNMKEEEKRKVRIAAGGLQSIWRLRSLFNILRYGWLSFQFVSHRVLRWTLTPLLLFLLIPINGILAFQGDPVYIGLFILQGLFYLMAITGYQLEKKKVRNKLLFVPYYFVFMNINVMQGFVYILKNKGSGTWEKSKRDDNNDLSKLKGDI